jgi:hypothetical protein
MLIGKNNTRKKEKIFKEAIKGENVSFNTKEQWNNNFIGFDESKNILMFIKLINQEASFLRIDLNDLKSCQINRKTRDFKKEKKLETELQTLDLELTLSTKNEIITLNFYDINDEFSEDLEMKRAEKWQTLIQQSKLKVSSNKYAA